MATKITLHCDVCCQEPQWMGKPAKNFLYKLDMKFVQCESKYELCSIECMYSLMQSMLDRKKQEVNDNAK